MAAMQAKKTMKPPYFKLNGNETDGWSLMMFKYKPKYKGMHVEYTEYTDWYKPKQFNSLIEVVATIEEESEKNLAV
jgi:hypothetical protein